ncbi:MAG: hypothetical protein ACTH2Y_14235 [Corynebacterium sp.]|uniref:hypothetical protein n=1 Tax=Corynebacterium sp. TaxID=1720 RepID=UPI003F91A513
MTPEEARALEHGTTPGPWTASECTGFIAAAEGERPVLTAERGDWWCEEDHRLAAAAPDMRATIAAQTWEYRAQYREVWGAWLDVTRWTNEEEARLSLTPYQMKNATTRLVRRLVGPVEVEE